MPDDMVRYVKGGNVLNQRGSEVGRQAEAKEKEKETVAVLQRVYITNGSYSQSSD